MSAIKRNDAAIVGVDPSTADVLRRQTLVVLEAKLLRRRYDLGHPNIDRLATRDAERDPQARAELDATIAADREAAITLDRLIANAAAAF